MENEFVAIYNLSTGDGNFRFICQIPKATQALGHICFDFETTAKENNLFIHLTKKHRTKLVDTLAYETKGRLITFAHIYGCPKIIQGY